MIDDEFFETQGIGSPIRPDGQPCIMAGAVKAMELYQILDEVLVDLYLNANDSEDTKHRLIRILEIDSKLQMWNRSLPEHLRLEATATRDFLVERQATVLRARLVCLCDQIQLSSILRYGSKMNIAFCTHASSCSARLLYPIVFEMVQHPGQNYLMQTIPALLKQCSQNVHAYASVLPRN